MGSRSRSREHVRRSLQREIEEEPVLLPPVNKELMQERFKKTVIGRIFCKECRHIESIIAVLPKPHIWDVEGRARGFDLGNDRFQFDFDSEDDLVRVLSKRPYHYNSWSFSLERWEPNIRGDFPSKITFWIQSKCLPPEYRNEEALKRIGSSMGDVVGVDEKSAKLQVAVDVSKPLKFEKKALSADGEEVTVTFKYEKLHRYCYTCKMISHEERSCPLLSEEERFQKRAERSAAARLAEEEDENLFPPHKGQSSLSRPDRNSGRNRELPRWDAYDASKGTFSAQRDFSRQETKDLNHNRRPVWHRLSENKEQPRDRFRDVYYPRYREKSKGSSEDQMRRRVDESVATSSWRPRQANSRDDDSRMYKSQILDGDNQRGFRHRSDRRHESAWDNRDLPRRINDSISPRRKEYSRSEVKLAKEKLKPGAEEGSKTITDLGFRLIQSHGQSFYRDISSKVGPSHGKKSNWSPPHYDKGKRVAREDLSPKSGYGYATERHRNVHPRERTKEAVTYRVKSPFIDSHEKSQAQLSIEKEVAELSSRKVPISIPKVLAAPVEKDLKDKRMKGIILTEEEENQVLQDAAKCTAPLSEVEEKELLKCAEADAAAVDAAAMEEDTDLSMDKEDVDNDDLLEEDLHTSLDQTVSDQVKPLSRSARVDVSPSPSLNSKRHKTPPSRRPAKERIEFPALPLQKSAHRKRRAESKYHSPKNSRVLLGISSRKRNAVHLNGSPSKRLVASSSLGKQKKKKPSSSSVPHTGVFPSAMSKKIKCTSGLVGSQNPPSKN